MLLTTLNLDDSYFIRLTDQEDVYVHPVGELSKSEEEDAFLIKEGVKGAGTWSKSNAERFIKESGADNLEMVSVKSVLY